MSCVSHPRPRRRQGQARAAARRPQRADGERQGHRRDPHRARRADHHRDRRQGRQGDPARPISAGRRGRDPKESLQAGRRRRRAHASGGRSPSPTTASATKAEAAVAAMKPGDILLPGEHPLPQGRGEERSGLRRRAGQARRPLRQRRLLGRAPRARLDRRARPQAAGLCRPHHAGRTRGAGEGARGARSGRWSPSSAAPRSRPSSICSGTWSARSTR